MRRIRDRLTYSNRPWSLAPPRSFRALVSVLVLFSLVVLLGASSYTAAATSPTVVTFTFDDGRQTQYSTRAPLAAHGMRGTFFVNSGLVGSSASDWHMTWGQLHDLAADGNEITGHTLTHSDLTKLTSTNARREICDDRTNLLNQGFSPVISFAYPYGAYNSTVQGIARDCGYTSARQVSGIRAADCSSCPYAETIPPLDPYATRAPMDIGRSTTLATMQGYVTQAEDNGGGWVQLVFHDICNGCDNLSVTLSQFTAFLDWLQPRAANGTVVKTVQEVIGGGSPLPPGGDTTAPSTTIACNGSGCSSAWYAGSVTVTLSASDGGSGVAVTRYTTDGSDPSDASATYGGPVSVAGTTTVKYRSWDNAGNVEPTKARLIQIDTTAPVVAITQPPAGATIAARNVKVVAAASDSASGIARVAFYVDGTLIGTSTSAPHQVQWRPRKSSSGQHVLTAVATDIAGNSTTSAPVTVTLS
jgi:peptidoglycan/xylan/chitin deacetylase (PgdA/CDA1 family)